MVDQAHLWHPFMDLLPEQSRAARALLDWTQIELAHRAGVSRSTVRDFEGGRHALSRASEAQIVAVFEGAGVDLLPPGSMGPGVRLRRALPPALKGDPCSSC
jgi:transcriptional regulator with XRE-family HTH domain